MPVVELVTPAELARVLGLPATDTGVINAASASNETVSQYLTPDVDHTQHASDKEAALSVAVDIFQARTAAGGQVVGLDMMPLPFRLGSMLLSTVGGLLGPCMDQRGEVG